MDNARTCYRSHSCGELRMEHVGQTVTLAGFLENFREVGASLGFAVLRDSTAPPRWWPRPRRWSRPSRP